MIEVPKGIQNVFLKQRENVSWPPLLFHLLRMCNSNLSSVFSLSALGPHFPADRSLAVRRAHVVENFELSDLEILDTSHAAFVCPVTRQEETDVVILVKCPDKALLADLENTIITGPLSAVPYLDFCQSLAALCDHPVFIRSMREREFCLAPAEEKCKVADSVVAPILLYR
jgi:hypothetical protein